MPPQSTEGEMSFLGRVRAAASGLLDRLRGGPPQQAMPISQYRGHSGPVVPYHERHDQLLRSRRRQHGPYALVFILVLLALVVAVFYGLTWALSGLTGGGSRATPTAVPKPGAAGAPLSTASVPVLPTAAPGGTAPIASPSPLPGLVLSPVPGPGPGTPDASGQRTYTVKPGDTPGQIAREFNVSVEALMRTNNITDPRTLRVGDRLTIPPPSTPTSAPPR